MLACAFLCFARFLPSCCDTFVAVVVEVDDSGNEIVVVKDNNKGGRKLSLATWQVAWDRYALAIDMVKMLEFGVAMRYKQAGCLCLCGVVCFLCLFSQVILEVAMGAAAETPERNTTLGIIYDEQLRKEVENKCGQLGATWDYAQLFMDVDESILRKARRWSVCCVMLLQLVV